VAATAAARRRAASNTRIAAKARRQKVFVVVLAVILGIVLVYEVPKTLKLTGKGGSTSGVTSPGTPSTPSTPQHAKSVPGSGNGADPFVARALSNGDGAPAGAGGRPDPFTPPATPSSAAAAPSTPAPLPQQIVIGRPGGHRVATHGWIVILASIPTHNGRGDAVSFARSAGRNVGRLSILNSSHSRPLRGGYWVVYAGPYGSLGRVTHAAGNIHAAGYRTAYVRQLVAYK
jgi:hypothetical protein